MWFSVQIVVCDRWPVNAVYQLIIGWEFLQIIGSAAKFVGQRGCTSC